MEFFFSGTDIKRLHPANTRLLTRQAEPYPDGKCLRVALNLTPFQEKPCLALTLLNTAEEIVASTILNEPVTCGLELTLHIRKLREPSAGEHKLEEILSYPDLDEIDRHFRTVELPMSTD